MKKLNFGFKRKNKNKDVLVKRNWKKTWIWITVGAVLIAGIIPAIYFPVVNSRNAAAQEPIPSALRKASVDAAVNQANEAEEATDAEDQIWGLYIDIEENEKSDFAIYGGKEMNDDGEEEFNKDEFNGPFSYHVEYTTYEWITFYDQTSEDATEMLAEFIWRINEDQLNGNEYGKVQEEYFEISLLDGEVEWDSVQEQQDFKTMEVNKVDKNSEGEEEDTYELSFGDSTSVSGPLWLTFQGDDLVFVVTDIATTVDEGTITEQGDFDDLMYQTGLYDYDE